MSEREPKELPKKKITFKQKVQLISMFTAVVGGGFGMIYSLEKEMTLPFGAKENLPDYDKLIVQYEDFNKLWIEAQEKIQNDQVRKAIEIFNSRQFLEDSEAKAKIDDANKIDPHSTARKGYTAGTFAGFALFFGSLAGPIIYKKVKNYYHPEDDDQEPSIEDLPEDDDQDNGLVAKDNNIQRVIKLKWDNNDYLRKK
jgi:hypothetical protein